MYLTWYFQARTPIYLAPSPLFIFLIKDTHLPLPPSHSPTFFQEDTHVLDLAPDVT